MIYLLKRQVVVKRQTYQAVRIAIALRQSAAVVTRVVIGAAVQTQIMEYGLRPLLTQMGYQSRSCLLATSINA